MQEFSKGKALYTRLLKLVQHTDPKALRQGSSEYRDFMRVLAALQNFCVIEGGYYTLVPHPSTTP